MGVFVKGAGWMYEGMVVGSRTKSYGYDDDRFYEVAIVWNPAAKETFEVSGQAIVIDGLALRDEMSLAYAERAAAAEAKRVAHGKKVRVVKGRKVAKGTEGTVIWMGESRYGYKVTKRLGLKDAAGTVHWTAESNVEVIAA